MAGHLLLLASHFHHLGMQGSSLAQLYTISSCMQPQASPAVWANCCTAAALQTQGLDYLWVTYTSILFANFVLQNARSALHLLIRGWLTVSSRPNATHNLNMQAHQISGVIWLNIGKWQKRSRLYKFLYKYTFLSGKSEIRMSSVCRIYRPIMSKTHI